MALQRARRGESGGVLSPETAAQMLRPQHAPFGLGLLVNDSGRFEHGGSNRGFRCVFYAEDDTALVVMTNGSSGAGLYGEIARGVAPVLGWQGFEPETRSLSSTPVALDGYAGKYAIAAFGNYPFVIEQRDGHLVAARDEGANYLEFYAETKTRFIAETGWELEFHIDDSGTVDSVKSSGGGGVPPFTAQRAE